MIFDELLEMSETELEIVAASMRNSAKIRKKNRIKDDLQAGRMYCDRLGEFRKILDSSTRHIIFLEHYSRSKEKRVPEAIPKISQALVDIIVCWRQKGGLHYVMDLELENDWVIRSVTDRTFSNWLGRAESVSLDKLQNQNLR